MGIIPSTPDIIPQPFANIGQRNVIEDTSSTPGAPNATWEQGFPPITMQNKQAGGKPPLGMDMNGVLFQLSQNAFFQQSGGVYPWNAELNYLAGAHVLGSDGKEYRASQPSGPDVPSGSGYVGAQDPTTAASVYWLADDPTLKADVDLGNITADGNAAIAHAALPSQTSGVSLSIPANGGTVTVPDDGYLLFMVNGVANQQSYAYLFGRLKIRTQWSGEGSYPIFLPVTKDEVVTVGYANLALESLTFIYANGTAPTT